MGFFKYVKQGLEAAYSDEGPSEEALASLSPEQRDRYDAQMDIFVEAQGQIAGDHLRLQQEHAQRIRARPLQGAAGEYLYGPAQYPGVDPNELMRMNAAEQMEWSAQQAKVALDGVFRNPFGRKSPGHAPPAKADDRPPREVMEAECSARAQARVPYLAPERLPVMITRLATRGKWQVEEVLAYLASSGLGGRPDLVYGLYRVPDRISPTTFGSEKRQVVEWDVVHAATEALPPAAAPAAVWFDGEAQWVARASGDPSVLDEDLVLNYLVSAGVAPEQTLGIARHLTINGHGGGEGSNSIMWSRVEGVHGFHAAGLGTQVHAHMLASRPLPLGSGPPVGIHVEVLNWQAISLVVHPRRHHPPETPSPFPYLPSTPQELLQAYLEVVGIHPSDSYAAQATKDEPSHLGAQTDFGFMTMETNTGPEQACADGTPRRRLAGTDLVVFAYRDRPEYVIGRERWAAYQREVYQGDLSNETGTRRAVAPAADEGVPIGVRSLLKAADLVDRVIDPDSDPIPSENPHRYC
nr:hypothetical protein [Acidimicrobiia bacterium]